MIVVPVLILSRRVNRQYLSGSITRHQPRHHLVKHGLECCTASIRRVIGEWAWGCTINELYGEKHHLAYEHDMNYSCTYLGQVYILVGKFNVFLQSFAPIYAREILQLFYHITCHIVSFPYLSLVWLGMLSNNRHQGKEATKPQRRTSPNGEEVPPITPIPYKDHGT